jgi:uncharacterized protein
MLTDEIEKLRILHQEGELSTDEYEAAVQQLIKQPAPNLVASVAPKEVLGNNPSHAEKPSELMGLSVKDYVVLMHLSQYAGFLIPFGGMIAPIVLWSIGKEVSADVDENGREIINWLISSTIYMVVCIALSCIAIGIPFLIALVVTGLILPLIAALDFTKGKTYRYPLTMRLIK